MLQVESGSATFRLREPLGGVQRIFLGRQRRTFLPGLEARREPARKHDARFFRLRRRRRRHFPVPCPSCLSCPAGRPKKRKSKVLPDQHQISLMANGHARPATVRNQARHTRLCLEMTLSVGWRPHASEPQRPILGMESSDAVEEGKRAEGGKRDAGRKGMTGARSFFFLVQPARREAASQP